MKLQPRLFHLHALSALHCGIGQSDGVVDLPIARARATKLPIVPGSSLRGVLRDEVASNASDGDAEALFGPSGVTDDKGAFAGALAVGDASLLALPVRSLGGIVCYATSPFILGRYARDLKRAGRAAPPTEVPEQNVALIPPGSANTVKGRGEANAKVVLEDVDLEASEAESAKKWADHVAAVVYPGDNDSQCDVMARFAILPDDVMDFLAETATEVRARVAIDSETGTVKRGALWYEENLPAESMLWGVFTLSASSRPGDRRSEDELARAMPNGETLLQLGGNASVGHGLVRFLAEESAS